MPKNVPIPRIPQFKPRSEPLKASELNLMVDAINALTATLSPSQIQTGRRFEKTRYPFHPVYRYDITNAAGYVSVTSGKVIERFLNIENTAPIYHSVSNTWQVPDDPLELAINIDEHAVLAFEVDIDGHIVANTPTISILDEENVSNCINWLPPNPEDTNGRAGEYNISLAKLVVLPDKPNGVSNLEWAAFEINAAESHFYWGQERLFDNTSNAETTGEGRVLKGYDEATNKYLFRNVISNNSNAANSFVEVNIAELANSVEISAALSSNFSNVLANGVTGFCIWEYEDNATATTFWQEFENGILTNTGAEPSPFDPGDPKLFTLPIFVP